MADFIGRHGESVDNRDKVFAGGQRDPELTDLGREQAIQFAVEIALLEYDFDRVVSSELVRAKDTARPIVDILGPGTEYYTDERLNEYDLGTLTGTKVADTPNDQVIFAEGVEDPQLFQDRVIEAIDCWSEQGKNTLYIAHMSVIRVLQTRELGIPASDFRSLPKLGNAQMHQVNMQALQNG